MTNIESYRIINTINNKTCYICEGVGSPLYQDLEDKNFDTPGDWSMLYCPKCKLSWLDPQPDPDEISRVYNSYYTHQVRKVRRLVSPQNPIRNYILYRYYGYKELEKQIEPHLSHKILSLHPFFKEIVGMSVMHLSADQRGELLDVGCGSGQFLSTMKSLGWGVMGVEIDENATAIAQKEYGLKIYNGNLEEAQFPNNSFDVVTLNHVIEHVYDPIKILIECRRILKPLGKLILTTPNLESLGHTIFRKDWRGLEIPRHLMVFSHNSIEQCTQKAGFKTIELRGSARVTRDVYLDSKLIRDNQKAKDISKLSYKLYSYQGWLFQLLEETARMFFKFVPDEILYIGERNDLS